MLCHFLWKFYDRGIMEWVFGKLGPVFLVKNAWEKDTIWGSDELDFLYCRWRWLRTWIFPKTIDGYGYNLVGIDRMCYWRSTQIWWLSHSQETKAILKTDIGLGSDSPMRFNRGWWIRWIDLKIFACWWFHCRSSWTWHCETNIATRARARNFGWYWK